MRLEPLLVDSFKELLDLVVNKDTRVELVNHSFNGWCSPKLFEHGSLLTGGSVPVSFRDSNVCIKAKCHIALAATHMCPYVRSSDESGFYCEICSTWSYQKPAQL